MKVKETNLQSGGIKMSQQVIVGFVLALVVVVVLIINLITSMSLRDTVDVLVFKNAVPAEGLITEDNMEKKTMLKAEYEKEGVITLSDGTQRRQIILYEDKDRLLGSTAAYASYYIRENTPVYWDALTKETTREYSYLYEMDGELIKLSFSGNEFGQMIVPGDCVNIRVRYTEENYELPTESEYMDAQEDGITLNEPVTVQTMLFNNATILDMLNANGESIYDKYAKFIALPKAEQTAALNSEEFKAATAPGQILLCVTEEEADMYMNIKSKGATYMMTLLPRNGSNVILNALSGLSTE